jgi:predicted NBD/HSP70 family sugar kinase/mannose-6-phosphate isomerase class I
MHQSLIAGIDIGGSHISGAIILEGKLVSGSYKKIAIDAQASSQKIIDNIVGLLQALMISSDTSFSGIGISIPGPFDYENGVSKMVSPGKFEHLFGLHIEQLIRTRLSLLDDIPILFENDATCFLLGQVNNAFGKKYDKVIGLTLGTGLGSVFFSKGKVVVNDPLVPPDGHIYNLPFADGLAEDYASVRWFISSYELQSGSKVNNVKEIFDRCEQDPVARKLFAIFGKNLALILLERIKLFQPDAIVLGGNISRAYQYFLPSIQEVFKSNAIATVIVIAEQAEENTLLAAASLVIPSLTASQTTYTIEEINWRKTKQFLLPKIKSNKPVNGYDIYPAFSLTEGEINSGYNKLAEVIAASESIVIDGYIGILWDELRKGIDKQLVLLGKHANWYDIKAAIKSENEIASILEPFIGDEDPVFGKIYPGQLADFYDKAKLKLIKPDKDAPINIIYGCGAHLAGWSSKLLYVDLPKNELQFRSRAGVITNLGFSKASSAKMMYKQFYFIDWIVLNKHKKTLLPNIEIIIDGQDTKEPVFTTGAALQKTFEEMSRSFFRVRPWFEAGVWGGNWMKKNIEGLNTDEVNYAWSFELITPENGLLLQQRDRLMEISFDFLMYYNNEAVLGEAAKRFGDEFPIRFDFLDTFSGGNLSIQCHPNTAYIKETFGENYTQDETYYILDCAKDAEVYLGFTDDISPAEFEEQLADSYSNGTVLQVENYVQKHHAKKHELFLIPAGTIHCSGINNLVLEISSTPYIYTFKMYDWLRLDLDGMPRPLNIQRGIENLNYERKGNYVKEYLIAKPIIISATENARVVHLQTHENHFYDVHRLEFLNEIEINTENNCHVLSLVEGSEVEIQANGLSHVFHYAETFVVPAKTAKYKLINRSGTIEIKVIKAFVKKMEHVIFKIESKDAI